MARCPFATWDPIIKSPGPYRGGPLKVVHHKTQGMGYPRATYTRTRGVPHFTVTSGGIWQHFDTATASTALRNADGGVQTNLDGAIQIEVEGYSGQDSPPDTLRNLVRLLKWIGPIHDVPWVWPSGRPPKTAEDGYGTGQDERVVATWDNKSGHFGHSQVPENSHWDPAYTDAEWKYLQTHMGAVSEEADLTPTEHEWLEEVVVKTRKQGSALARIIELVSALGSDAKADALADRIVARLDGSADAAAVKAAVVEGLEEVLARAVDG